MNTRIRRIAAAASIALMASTAIAPMASARDARGHNRHSHSQHRGNDNTGLIVGLGIAALIGTAIIAGQSQRHEPTYTAPAYYPPPPPAYYPPSPPAYYPGSYPQPTYSPAYSQPVYQQPAYAQPSYVAQPTCTTINDLPACLDQYGNWQYLR